MKNRHIIYITYILYIIYTYFEDFLEKQSYFPLRIRWRYSLAVTSVPYLLILQEKLSKLLAIIWLKQLTSAIILVTDILRFSEKYRDFIINALVYLKF